MKVIGLSTSKALVIYKLNRFIEVGLLVVTSMQSQSIALPHLMAMLSLNSKALVN